MPSLPGFSDDDSPLMSLRTGGADGLCGRDLRCLSAALQSTCKSDGYNNVSSETEHGSSDSCILHAQAIPMVWDFRRG